jgi:hypothetical protein
VPVDVGKAAIQGIATAGTAAAVASVTSVAILPIAAGFAVGIVVACGLDELEGKQSVCRAAWSAIDVLFR